MGAEGEKHGGEDCTGSDKRKAEHMMNLTTPVCHDKPTKERLLEFTRPKSSDVCATAAVKLGGHPRKRSSSKIRSNKIVHRIHVRRLGPIIITPSVHCVTIAICKPLAA